MLPIFFCDIAISGVKQFLEFANCQQQQEPTEDLNIEAVPDGEPYIEMVCSLCISYTVGNVVVDTRTGSTG